MSFDTLEAFNTFLEGKSAAFTLTSHRTQQSFTYRLKVPKNATPGDDVRFVEYRGMNGQWHYMGNLQDGLFRFTRKSSGYMRDHPATKAFTWFFEKVKGATVLPEGVTVTHEGKCSMCGRQLTDPVSVKRGIGPECIKKELQHEFQGKGPAA